MSKPDDMYEAFVASQVSRPPRRGAWLIKLAVSVVAIFVIELPAYNSYLDASTCVARSTMGDLSCTAVSAGMGYWQVIALPLIGLVLWLLFRTRRT